VRREEGLLQEVKVSLFRWTYMNRTALCGNPFWEAKRGL
jgi:hypothetical protein